MAKSKYLVELEEFKTKLPEVLLKHANMNGIDVCSSGLADFFKEMGVEWKGREEAHYMHISARCIMLPVEGTYYEVTSEGQDSIVAFEKDIRELAKKYGFWQEGKTSIDIDEYYI